MLVPLPVITVPLPVMLVPLRVILVRFIGNSSSAVIGNVAVYGRLYSRGRCLSYLSTAVSSTGWHDCRSVGVHTCTEACCRGSVFVAPFSSLLRGLLYLGIIPLWGGRGYMGGGGHLCFFSYHRVKNFRRNSQNVLDESYYLFCCCCSLDLEKLFR